MNKCVSLVVAVLFLVLLLSGCNQVRQQDIQEHMGSTVDPNSEYDKETSSSGFLIKEKKYTYQGNNVMILSLENQTNLDYSIILTGEFYDAAGQKLKTESKSFEGFAAGYQNYFVFQPGICFERFNCTLELVDFQGIAFAQYIQTPGPVSVFVQRLAADLKTGEYLLNGGNVGIFGRWQIVNTYNKVLQIDPTFVFFDNTGNILFIDSRLREKNWDPVEKGKESESTIYRPMQQTDIAWADKDSFIWPEEFTGAIKGIVALRAVREPSAG